MVWGCFAAGGTGASQNIWHHEEEKICGYTVLKQHLKTSPRWRSRMSLSNLGSDLHCRCIQMERRRIGKLIDKVEMFPPSSHCKDTEIIATLKGSGKEICLDVSAPWVKKIIEQILAKHKRNSYSPKTWNKRTSKKP
uniref:Chemokine interleukin-8-like domain-containing protein n=1 Tax=Oncorhynchus tshawytscha TaxID=74940 RepID=A0AAZ3STH7_ONCTS